MKAKIFQIFYSRDTEKSLDPGFTPLDNLANPRPDWYEIWPIVTYFDRNPLDDECWYGFFSPKFYEKTSFRAQKVFRWIRRYSDSYDVLVMSRRLRPEYRNVFEQAEELHPGITGVAQACFDALGWRIDLQDIETEGDKAVFSNYFVAKGWVWRIWLKYMKQFVDLADDTEHPLYDSLNSKTTYLPGAPYAPLKIFIAERVMSILLANTLDANLIAKRPNFIHRLVVKWNRRFS